MRAETVKPGGTGVSGEEAGAGCKRRERRASESGGGEAWRNGGVGRGKAGQKCKQETAAARLLDKCLTELLTGSTIETTKASNARRMEMFLFMVKCLLTATMKENRKSRW